MIPSFTPSSVWITDATCSSPSSACVPGPRVLWTETPADRLYTPWSNSTPFDISDWDTSLEPLRLQGQGTNASDRIVLRGPNGDSPQPYLDGVAVLLAQNVTVKYPQRSYYTLSSSFVSLLIDCPPLPPTVWNADAFTVLPRWRV